MLNILLPQRCFITLIQVQRENGKVAIIRRMENIASRRAQIPGPSGSAKKVKEDCKKQLQNLINKENILFVRLNSKRSFKAFLFLIQVNPTGISNGWDKWRYKQ